MLILLPVGRGNMPKLLHPAANPDVTPWESKVTARPAMRRGQCGRFACEWPMRLFRGARGLGPVRSGWEARAGSHDPHFRRGWLRSGGWTGLARPVPDA